MTSRLSLCPRTSAPATRELARGAGAGVVGVEEEAWPDPVSSVRLIWSRVCARDLTVFEFAAGLRCLSMSTRVGAQGPGVHFLPQDNTICISICDWSLTGSYLGLQCVVN